MVCSCVGWTVPGMFFLEEGGEVRCGLHRVVENYIYDVHELIDHLPYDPFSISCGLVGIGILVELTRGFGSESFSEGLLCR